jgi:hypothetical protein
MRCFILTVILFFIIRITICDLRSVQGVFQYPDEYDSGEGCSKHS